MDLLSAFGRVNLLTIGVVLKKVSTVLSILPCGTRVCTRTPVYSNEVDTVPFQVQLDT